MTAAILLLLLSLQVLAEDSAGADFQRGMEMARLQRWKDAEAAFRSGERKAPSDKRFPIELAGVLFRQNEFGAAKKSIGRALRLDPRDAYANEFLGTIFFLEDNLDAALKYWNRAGKPRIEEIRMDPEPPEDPVLVDRAFAFAPASTLQLEDLRTTRARLDKLGVFSRYRFELDAAPNESFNLLFRSGQKSGLGSGRLFGLASLLGGLPYKTVFLEFYDLGHSATNVTSLLRWDAQKRRAMLSLSGPLKRDPKWRYRLHADARRENWDITRSLAGTGEAAPQFVMRKVEAGADLESVVNGRWSWRSGVSVSHRMFPGLAQPSPLFSRGVLLSYHMGADVAAVRIPERRLLIEASLGGEFGRLFAGSLRPYRRMQASASAHWFASTRGDDYEMYAAYRAGKTAGDIPFDELFMLGLERDNDLWLRGHAGTDHGRKGSAPVGRDFSLASWECDKFVYRNGFVTLKAGPFVDFGRTFDSTGTFGSRKWLWDTGAQIKLQVLDSLRFVFIYGKDLRSGRDVFYSTVLR